MSAELNLADYFKERHVWLQHAAKLLIEKDCLDRTDIDELVGTCIKEVVGKSDATAYPFPATAFKEPETKSLRLCSIGNIIGINALAPRRPLEFGKGNLSVIYGNNGSGKSGYVRILKHTCGSRHPGELHKNVYCPPSAKQSSTITYNHDSTPAIHEWDAADGIIDDLRGVDIYDTHCGNIYVKGENEVTYEPPVLSFFSELIGVCEEVSTDIDKRIRSLVSKKPVLPVAYTLTTPGNWYTRLSERTTAAEIAANCTWDNAKELKLEELTTRLAEQAPAEKARLLRKQKEYLDSIITNTETLYRQLSDDNRTRLLALQEDATQKAEAARIAAEQMFAEAPLDGVGTQVWTLLWEQARKYSEELAYQGKAFPVTEDDALCVLCHQPLSEAARKRFLSFEAYVMGEMKKQAESAQNLFDEALGEIDDLPTAPSLKLEADAAGVSPEGYTLLQAIFDGFKSRKDSLLSEAPNDLPQILAWLDEARQLSEGYAESAKKFDEDAKEDSRAELGKEKLDLEATRWFSQQQKAIEEEVNRLMQYEILQEASRRTSTTGLSKKKGELANSLITDAFIQRFKDELGNLNASKLHIELVKSQVTKGRVLHCIQLKEAHTGSPPDVLSEGEFRMISLAAFLADVTGKAHDTPFVFDDPISSLDQDYEESVVQRLVSLANERQVIVFTHRLSLLGLIQLYGDKAGIKPEVICINSEYWGTGEPGDTPTWAETPKKANNILLDQRLPKARKVYEEDGQRAYEMHAQSICTEFRKVLERTIEIDLMADVVQRFRRDVMTKNKVGKLSKITPDDCRKFDDLMTKYSRYEHSQPGEAPVPLPTPDELKTDLEGLKAWRDEFATRAA